MNDAILILCGECGGKKRWLALEPVTKKDAKRWMWQAAKRGDRIATGVAVVGGQFCPVCKCPQEVSNG